MRGNTASTSAGLTYIQFWYLSQGVKVYKSLRRIHLTKSAKTRQALRSESCCLGKLAMFFLPIAGRHS